MVEEENQYRKCPYCKEQILFDAIKCKHCGEFLDNEGSNKRRKTKKDSSTKVVVKTKEGFFLKTLNTGCIVAVILIVLVSVAIILGSKMNQSQKAADEYGADSQENYKTQGPAHDCTEANLQYNYKFPMAGYRYEITEIIELTVPGSVTIGPQEKDRMVGTLILLQGEPGQEMEIRITPLDSGAFWFGDPRGYEILQSNSYWIKTNNTKFETTLQCNTPYMFAVSQLENSVEVKVVTK